MDFLPAPASLSIVSYVFCVKYHIFKLFVGVLPLVTFCMSEELYCFSICAL